MSTVLQVCTVKIGCQFSKLFHWLNFPWRGIIKLILVRESLVSGIPAGDRKLLTFFYTVEDIRCYQSSIKVFHLQTISKLKTSCDPPSKSTNHKSTNYKLQIHKVHICRRSANLWSCYLQNLFTDWLPLLFIIIFSFNRFLFRLSRTLYML